MKKIECVLMLSGLIGTSLCFADTQPMQVNQIFSQAGGSAPLFGSAAGMQTLALLGYRYMPSWYFLEADVGGWAGSRHSGIAAGLVGLDYKDLSAGIGPGGITDTSSSLGTHFQFLSSLRWTFNPYPVYIAYNHVSNGSGIFSWGKDQPNDGENFFSLGYTYSF